MDDLSTPIKQGGRVRLARKLTRLSRVQFCHKHGFNINSCQAWEDGRYKQGLKFEIANQLVSALAQENINCSIEWLMHGQGIYPKRVSDHLPIKSGINRSEPFKELEKHNHLREKNFKMIKAIKGNNIEVVKRLISEGANFHELQGRDTYLYSARQDTALHFAAGFAGEAILRLFIKLGTYINVRNRHKDAPMHIACLENNLHTLRALIDLGAGIEVPSREGAPPLNWSAYLGHSDCCEILLDAGANINNSDEEGVTALHWACQNNQPHIIKLLYERGAHLEILNCNKETPMDWAIKSGRKEALAELLKYI